MARVENRSVKDYPRTIFDEHWRMRGTSFFFLDGVLHQKKRINRAINVIYCVKFNYVEHHTALGRHLILPPDFREDVAYPWTEVRRRQRPAFVMSEASKLLNRTPRTIKDLWKKGKLPKPHCAYGPHGRGYSFVYSEDDMMAMRDYFAEIHRGRPRKDKMITTVDVPSKEQLRAAMGHARVLYVMNDDGEPVPIWLAEEI